MGLCSEGKTEQKTKPTEKDEESACFGGTYTKMGTTRRLARPLRKDDTQTHEAFHI